VTVAYLGMRVELAHAICRHLLIFFCKIARPAWIPKRIGLARQAGPIIISGTKSLFSRRHGQHRQPHRREMFDRHEFAETP
jgi:hypothetical protein